MTGFEPNCRQAAKDLVAILSILRERGLIKNSVSEEEIRRCFIQCQTCRGKRPKKCKCLGWSGSFRETTAIEIPFEIKKRNLSARVSGCFDFGRSSARKGLKLKDWQNAPIAAASFSIELWEVTGIRPCARHHIDLANPDQVGPVWHLQLGGLAAGEDRHKELEWLDVPRWPALPMDMVLVLELAIYSFRHDAWMELRETNPWRDIVKRSERLMFEHYFNRLDGYRRQREAVHSWLAYQCNRTSGWNPRPV